MKRVIDRTIGCALLGLSAYFLFLGIARYRLMREIDLGLFGAMVLSVLLAVRFFKMGKRKDPHVSEAGKLSGPPSEQNGDFKGDDRSLH